MTLSISRSLSRELPFLYTFPLKMEEERQKENLRTKVFKYEFPSPRLLDFTPLLIFVFGPSNYFRFLVLACTHTIPKIRYLFPMQINVSLSLYH